MLESRGKSPTAARIQKLSQDLATQDRLLLTQQQEDQKELLSRCESVGHEIEEQARQVEERFVQASAAGEQAKKALVQAKETFVQMDTKTQSNLKQQG